MSKRTVSDICAFMCRYYRRTLLCDILKTYFSYGIAEYTLLTRFKLVHPEIITELSNIKSNLKELSL